MMKKDDIRIVSHALDLMEAYEVVSDATCGAIATFVGTTRDHFKGKDVAYLEYEAYEPMAKKTMMSICARIRTKWTGVVHIAMFHRLGRVAITESSVILAISSPHRKEALEAVAYAIDELKATVPIWKLEVYKGDERVWKENIEWKSRERVMLPLNL